MTLDPVRRAVIVDIAYEIGGAGLAGFPLLLQALRDQRWPRAAMELRDSLLFSQVPVREMENMTCLVNGRFPFGVLSVEDLIRRHEGCVLTARPDAKGMWALGYGHDIPAPTGAIPTCTQDEADTWLAEDIALATGRARADLGAEYWGTA